MTSSQEMFPDFSGLYSLSSILLFSSLDCRFIQVRNHVVYLCNSHAELNFNICLLNELNNMDESDI